jgi:hypothetical protein
MATEQRELVRIIARLGWGYPKIAAGALASIVALGIDLVGGGCAAAHITAIADAIEEVLQRRVTSNRRRLHTFVGFFRWLAEHEAELVAHLGAEWVTSATPHHPLYRRSFSRTSAWAVLFYQPVDVREGDSFYRQLIAELLVATMMSASSVHARLIHARARTPKDYAQVAGPTHYLLNAAGRGMRRLLVKPLIHKELDALGSVLRNTDPTESAVAHWREWLRTNDVPISKKQSNAISDVLRFVDHAHGIRRAGHRNSVPRSPAEKEAVRVTNSRADGRAIKIFVTQSAESHRTVVTRYSRSLTDMGDEESLETDIGEESAPIIVFANVGCDSSTTTYPQLRAANGLRRATERAGIGLRWSPADLSPSEVVALNLVLIELSDSPDLRVARASLLMRTSLVLGRKLNEVRRARLWTAASSAVTATIEIVHQGAVFVFRVVVPQPAYRTELTAFEEAACFPVSPQLVLPDKTGIIADLNRKFGRLLPWVPFDSVTDSDIENLIKRLGERCPLLKRVRAARICEPLVTALHAQSASPVRAALTTARTRHEAHVDLHYTALPARQLQELYVRTLHRMGLAHDLDIGLPSDESEMVGNPRCPSDEAVKGLFRDLENVYDKACRAQRKSLDAMHNAYCRYVNAVLMLALGMRMMASPVPDYVDRDHGTALWGDKMRDDYERRFSFIAAVALELLIDYVEHRRDLLADFPTIVVDSFFFVFDDNHRPVPFSSSRFPGPGVRYPLDIRSLRRAMRSYLDRMGVSAQVIDALLGHTSAGRETWSPLSTFVASHLRDVVGEHVASYLDWVGVHRLRRPTWATRPSWSIDQ